MKTEIRWPWEIKSPITGPAVVIDVFAAAIRNVDVAMDKDRYAIVPLCTSVKLGIVAVTDGNL